MNFDAGFAAIELRPPSQSMDDPNGHSEDAASSTDEGGGEDYPGQSSSQSANGGIDLSFMSLEDLLYQLQQEISSSVSQTEMANRYRPSSTADSNSRKFLWNTNTRSLLENAILKLKLRFQSEMNGDYFENENEYFDTLNRLLLPLWPQGWMSADDLNEIVRHVSNSISNQLDDEILIDEQNLNESQYSMGQQQSNYGNGSEQSTRMTMANQSSILHSNNGSMRQQSTSGGGVSMCYICDRSFQSPHLLKIHISHMHTPKALICPHCQSRHSTLNGLRFHFSTKHKGVSQRFISDLIPPIPVVPPPLRSSVILSNSQQQQQSPSSGAPTATAYIDVRPIGNFDSSVTPNNISASIRNTFLPPATSNGGITAKNVRCRYCPKVYATQRAMLQHTYMKHHKERNCQCPECGETFGTAVLATLHRRYGHCNTTSSISDKSMKSDDTFTANTNDQYLSRNEKETMGATSISGPMSELLSTAMNNRIRSNGGKYHCRDCGAGFPMPSAVWAHRKKEHSESTSIKRRGGFLAMTDPKRNVGGQIFGYDQMRPSKDGSPNGKKKMMRVKCSVCSAIFSNGYACYLHKKKIHGEESIRRELNLSQKSSSTTPIPSTKIGGVGQATKTTTTASPKIIAITSSAAESASTPTILHSNPENVLQQQHQPSQYSLSGTVNQARISTSSSSSRDSSPFFQRAGGEGGAGGASMVEGIVRRRYEFHCQCGSTFYNGFAFSRHRQRTGCSEQRGALVKESVCGLCSEAFPTTELLNEHFANIHQGHGSGGNSLSTAVVPKFNSPATSKSSMINLEQNTMEEDVVLIDRETMNKYKIDSNESKTCEYRKSPQQQPSLPLQRMGRMAIGYATKTLPSTSISSQQQQLIKDKLSKTFINPSSSSSGIGVEMASSISLEKFPIRCLMCPFETLSMDALEEHARRHEKSVPNIGFGGGQLLRNTCPYCTYVTDSVSNFVRHTALHFTHGGNTKKNGNNNRTNSMEKTNQERRLVCTYCGRQFQKTIELMEHELRHSSGK